LAWNERERIRFSLTHCGMHTKCVNYCGLYIYICRVKLLTECNIVKYVGFDSLTVVTGFWDIILRCPVEVERRFRRTSPTSHWFLIWFILRSWSWRRYVPPNVGWLLLDRSVLYRRRHKSSLWNIFQTFFKTIARYNTYVYILSLIVPLHNKMRIFKTYYGECNKRNMYVPLNCIKLKWYWIHNVYGACLFLVKFVMDVHNCRKK
jgi:hypothetical protein